MVRVNLRDDFDIYYRNDRLNMWMRVEDEELANSIKESSFTPPATYTYDVKTIWLAQIVDNKIVFFKAKRKPNRNRPKKGK